LPRHFLTGAELDRRELDGLLHRALELKQAPHASRALEGRAVALVFEQPSTRTRTSFEVGIVELGGHPMVLRPGELQLTRGESVRDTAYILSRHSAIIGLRTPGLRLKLGPLAIEVWSGDRKLGEQEFTLVPESSTGPFRFELYVPDLAGAYVGYPLAESGHAAECHDLVLSKRMQRRLRAHTDSIVEFDGSYVPDAPPGVLVDRVNGRRWHGRICRLEAIFVKRIRVRRHVD